ncbi:MAG: hypothetical protein AAF903_07740 [Pseudomonadota bacterium]
MKRCGFNDNFYPGRVLFSNSENLIFLALSNRVCIFDANDGVLLKTLFDFPSAITDISITADDKYLITVSRDGVVKSWPLQHLRRGITAEGSLINSITVANDGSFFIVDEPGHPRLFDSHNTLIKTFTEHQKQANFVISRDSNFVVSANYDGTEAYIWNRDGSLRAAPPGHSKTINSIEISQDNKNIITASADGTIRSWGANSALRSVIAEYNHEIYKTLMVGTEPRVIAFLRDNTIRILSLTGNEVAKIPTQGTNYWGVVSPSRGFFVYNVGDNTAEVRDIDGTLKSVLSGHEGSINSIAISGDNKFIITSSEDGYIRVWNVNGTQKTKIHIDGHLFSLLSSNDNTYFAATVSENSGLRPANYTYVWNFDGTLKSKTKSSHFTKISNDGTFLVTQNEAVHFQVMEPNGTRLLDLSLDNGNISHVELSANGNLAITASHNGRIESWRVPSFLFYQTEDLVDYAECVKPYDSSKIQLDKYRINNDNYRPKNCVNKGK